MPKLYLHLEEKNHNSTLIYGEDLEEKTLKDVIKYAIS
jgi:hypothetical protein